MSAANSCRAIYETDTSHSGDGKTKRIGWFIEKGGTIAAEPMTSFMAALREFPVLVRVKGCTAVGQIEYTPDELNDPAMLEQPLTDEGDGPR